MLKNKAQIVRADFKTTLELPGPITFCTPLNEILAFRPCMKTLLHNEFESRVPRYLDTVMTRHPLVVTGRIVGRCMIDGGGGGVTRQALTPR